MFFDGTDTILTLLMLPILLFFRLRTGFTLRTADFEADTALLRISISSYHATGVQGRYSFFRN